MVTNHKHLQNMSYHMNKRIELLFHGQILVTSIIRKATYYGHVTLDIWNCFYPPQVEYFFTVCLFATSTNTKIVCLNEKSNYNFHLSLRVNETSILVKFEIRYFSLIIYIYLP